MSRLQDGVLVNDDDPGLSNDAPPSDVPDSVPRLAARLALNEAGLLPRVDAAAQDAGGSVLVWYQDADNWRRNNPILSQLAVKLSIAPATIDALFVRAAQIALTIT